MWWLASPVDRRTPRAQNLDGNPDWSTTTADWFRLWYGQSGPHSRFLQVDVPGCRLLVVGCCTTSEFDLPGVAVRLARGDTAALSDVDGSRVVIAVRSDDVLVAGDLAGQCPVFFASCDGQTVVSSHTGKLAELVGRSLNRQWLACQLLLPSASDVWWTGSPWQGVRTVRPGWVLRIGRDGAATSQPWLVLGVPNNDLATGGEALRAALQRAVWTRVGSAERPTVDLSGGLDSSTIAVLATHGTEEPVRAFTLTTVGVDDAAVAVEVARAVSGLVHARRRMPDEVLPYSGLDTLPAVDEPADYLVAVARMQWWRQHLAEIGSDIHLGGDGGDGVLIALPSYLADLVGPRTVGELWRHASGWARLRHQSPSGLVRAAAALRRTAYRDALTRAADQLLRGVPGPTGWARWVSWLDIGGASAWATPDARRLVAEQMRRHAEEHIGPITPGGLGIGDAVAWRSLNASARSLRADIELASACGIALHSPFLDDGIVRACWSVPASVRTTPLVPKPLLRSAVNGLVPAHVINRRTKGDYTALSYRGLHRNVDALDDLLAFSRLGALGLIDIRAVRADLRKGAAGIPIRLGAFDTVIGMELWLRSAEGSVPAMSVAEGGSGAYPT